MQIHKTLLGAAVLALFASSAFAEPGGLMMHDGVLVDANGMTLYTFDKDEPGKTNCYEQCAVNWPPLMADAGAQPEGDYTLVDRTDGGQQWAYKGMPLYYWKDDKQAGDMTGDGVGGVWHVVK